MSENQTSQAEDREATAEAPAKPGHDRVGIWIRQAWDLVTDDLPNYLVAGLLYTALIFVLGVKTFGIASFLVLGPLGVGIYKVILEKTRTGSTKLALLGEGFTAKVFPQALLASLVVAVFVSLGTVLCVIPGFLVWTIFAFTFPLIADRNHSFWPALEGSRRLVTPHLWTLALLQLALLGINLLGAAACGFGLAFTVPLTMAATAIAYRELANSDEVAEEDPSGPSETMSPSDAVEGTP